MAVASAGCRSRGAVRCSGANVSSARLSPICPSATTASSWSGPSSLAIAVSVGHRVRGLVLAERLDHGAAEEVLAAGGLAHERLLHRRVVAERGQRADERRPDELRQLRVELGDAASAASGGSGLTSSHA